jgi:hypothetical protein
MSSPGRSTEDEWREIPDYLSSNTPANRKNSNKLHLSSIAIVNIALEILMI